MLYRNLKTGAVINTPCMISGKDWQELSPAGFPMKKDTEKTTEETEKAEAETPKEEPKAEIKEEPKEEKKTTKGATIRPKKGK